MNRPLYILSIGNSYSADQQAFVHQMAAAAGIDIQVGIAYIGGCTFRRHMEEWNTCSTAYAYYENGKALETEKTLKEIITRQNWDYVTFQLGTEKKSYVIPNNPYLAELIELIRGFHPNVKTVYNISWPDADGSERAYFIEAFDSDRSKHWAHILDTAREAYSVNGIEYITPSGLAFMEAYKEYGDAMHRDKFHSSELARYMHACVWFEFFTGLRPPEDYAPTESSHSKGGPLPTDEQREHLRRYAHDAIVKLKANGGKTPDLFA